MRAICRTASRGVELRDVPEPEATAEHVVVKITTCGVNPGDKAWIAGAFPEIPTSRHDICGATAAGVVIATGNGVPRAYLGRKVAIYRSLKASEDCVGVWSEVARVHHLTCAILPDDVDEADYAASLVSCVTAQAFFDQMVHAGHEAVACTAGTSATGRALLGICLARHFPIISIVRTEESRRALAELDAPVALVRSDADFDARLATVAAGATAVFDGVGGNLLGRVAKALPPGATAYCYGFLAGNETLDFASSLLLFKSLTLTSFSVLRPLVRDAGALRRLLSPLEPIIGMSHFKTVTGKTYPFDDAADAISWAGPGKAVLKP